MIDIDVVQRKRDFALNRLLYLLVYCWAKSKIAYLHMVSLHKTLDSFHHVFAKHLGTFPFPDCSNEGKE